MLIKSATGTGYTIASGAGRYFPLTLGVSVVVLGGAVRAMLYAVLMWRRSRD